MNIPVILGPNIIGSFLAVNGGVRAVSGVFSYSSNLTSMISASVVGNANQGVNFSASDSNSIYGDSTTVQPKSLIFNYVIKY